MPRPTPPIVDLDALDRRLLRLVQEQCTLTAEELADRCGTSPSTALRRLKRLRSTGVIDREVAVVDGNAVGRGLLTIVNVRTKRGREADTDAFKRAMLVNPAVVQFYFVTGRDDYVVFYSASSMGDYGEFIESVLAIDPNLLTESNVVIRGLKTGLKVPIPPLAAPQVEAPRPQRSPAPVGLDALDRRILRVVQEDCMLTAEQLADRCGTSPSTALRRLDRLRTSGVIRDEVALVDASRIGPGLMMLVWVRLERENERVVDAFARRIVQHQNVQQFFFVTGTSDYLIILCVSSMEEYDQFLRDNLVGDAAVVLSNTSVVIRPLKTGLAIPI